MKQDRKKLKALRDRYHAACIICGKRHPGGLKLPFQLCKDGSLKTRFFCDPLLQGYPGLLHGGVIAAILDGAMTNCLFAHGKTAVTASLTVRFLFPVAARQSASLRARIKCANAPLYLMESELLQGKRVVARATGKFMERPEHFFEEKKNGKK